MLESALLTICDEYHQERATSLPPARRHCGLRLGHFGSVIDFLNVGLGQFRTGIFNLADVAILAGVAILFIEGYRSERSHS